MPLKTVSFYKKCKPHHTDHLLDIQNVLNYTLKLQNYHHQMSQMWC